ncbi:MAG: hypothetical protein JNM58_16235 [Xanthomonadaceae bacterium]|nr:hypothetical protein [Xanthomonadaceae bacterium]
MRFIMTAAALLFVLTGFASAETGETETVGQFLISIPARTVDPVIDYCSEKVPEIRNDLLEERAGLIDKLAEAGKPLMERLKNDPEFNAPVEESFRQKITDVHTHGLSILRQHDPDPNTTCRTILTNIQNANVDTLRKVIEDTYQKFRDTAPAQESQ